VSLPTKRRQERLRALVQQVTLPQITVTELANECHVSPQTIGRFMRGMGLTDEQERSLTEAMLRLLPTEAPS